MKENVVVKGFTCKGCNRINFEGNIIQNPSTKVIVDCKRIPIEKVTS